MGEIVACGESRRRLVGKVDLRGGSSGGEENEIENTTCRSRRRKSININIVSVVRIG